MQIKISTSSIVLCLIWFIMLPIQVNGQGRKFLKEKIETWGSCKSVAMTLTGGDVALYGKNGWAGVRIPIEMSNRLDELNEQNVLIDDVQITENGAWLILYGNNGLAWNGISYSLEKKLKEFNNRGEVITSVAFNDAEDWIIIGTENISASSNKIYELVEDGMRNYGGLWAAHLTDDGLVLCYERGYKFFGNVPNTLRNKLETTTLNVFRVKFLSDGAYFIADRNGKFAYYL
jgi:hypothetical protein